MIGLIILTYMVIGIIFYAIDYLITKEESSVAYYINHVSNLGDILPEWDKVPAFLRVTAVVFGIAFGIIVWPYEFVLTMISLFVH